MHFTRSAADLRGNIMKCAQIDGRFKNYRTSSMSLCGQNQQGSIRTHVPMDPIYADVRTGSKGVFGGLAKRTTVGTLVNKCNC